MVRSDEVTKQYPNLMNLLVLGLPRFTPRALPSGALDVMVSSLLLNGVTMRHDEGVKHSSISEGETMNHITTIGLDLAKNVFHIVGCNQHGKVMMKKRLCRTQLLPFMTNLPACLIGMKACGGAHHWARRFGEMGHLSRWINRIRTERGYNKATVAFANKMARMG